MIVDGHVIKHMLIDKGKTQKALSDESRISAVTLSYIVNGKSCTTNTAQRIADALGADLETILRKEA